MVLKAKDISSLFYFQLEVKQVVLTKSEVKFCSVIDSNAISTMLKGPQVYKRQLVVKVSC